MSTTTDYTEIQLCGHEHCEKYRRESLKVSGGSSRWCLLGHHAPIKLTADDWSRLMCALSSAAAESGRQGHDATASAQWELLSRIELQLGLMDDARKSMECASMECARD